MRLLAADDPRRSRGAIALPLVAGIYVAAAQLPVARGASADAALSVACGLLLAVAIVTVGAGLAVDARTQFVVWFSLLFLVLASVAVEGTLFAPGAAPPATLGPNLLRLGAASALMACVVSWAFAGRRDRSAEMPSRRLSGWLWRLAVAGALYVFLYLVLGGINYALLTHPYYETHAGSLVVPPAETILLYEPVRGLLIALSVLPLSLALRGRRGAAAIVVGGMLFLVGGVAPLLPQATLPIYLRVASLFEIFGQNLLTGVACAYLFRLD